MRFEDVYRTDQCATAARKRMLITANVPSHGPKDYPR